MRKLIFALIYCVCFSCAERGDDSIRLIPKGYEGPVLIIYDQSNGEPKEYEEGNRLYRIPNDGILKTQFRPNYGVQRHLFFYVDSFGIREEIPFVIVQNQDSLTMIGDRTKIYAFAEQTFGESKGYDPELGKFTISPSRGFYVGKLGDIEKSFRELWHFSSHNLEQFKIYE